MARDRANREADESLAIRAAWMHFIGGLTQAAVADRLGMPTVKAHRLIARAVANGAVRVTIEGDIVECIALEEALRTKFGLETCDVAPDLGQEDLPLQTLALTGAARLRRWLESGAETLVGVGHGRTLAATVRELPHFGTTGLQFVSLLGEFTRNFAANPHNVMHLLAEKTGAQSYVFPVPFFANSAEDREVLLAQRGVREVFEMAVETSLKIVGIGTVRADSQLVRTGMIAPAEIDAIVSAGAVGELLGHFFNAGGEIIETPLTDRTLSVTLDPERRERVVALAGGTRKIDAILAVLKSGRLTGLITDERTAQALLER